MSVIGRPVGARLCVERRLLAFEGLRLAGVQLPALDAVRDPILLILLTVVIRPGRGRLWILGRATRRQNDDTDCRGDRGRVDGSPNHDAPPEGDGP